MALMMGEAIPPELANSHAPTYDYYFLMKYDAHAQPLLPLDKTVLEQALNVCILVTQTYIFIYLYLLIDFDECSFE